MGCGSGRDLVSKAGASLVLAGPHQPVAVQLLVYGNERRAQEYRQTLLVREFARNPERCSLLQLAAEIAAGQVKQLFIFGGDPVFNAMRALAPDPATEGSRWIGPICKRKFRMWCGWVITKMPLRLRALARAARPLSRVMGRRPDRGRRLSRDSADDHAAVRRLSEIDLLNMFMGGPKTGRAGAHPGNIPRHRARREIFATPGRNSCTTVLPGTHAARSRRRRERGAAGGLAQQLWGPAAGADPRFSRDCFRAELRH